MKAFLTKLIVPLLLLFFFTSLWAAQQPVHPVAGRDGMSVLGSPEGTVCSAWQQVNAGGFDLGPHSRESETSSTMPYQGEESFELTIYEKRLYVGMEADNTLGARLWRSRSPGSVPASQSDWEEVIADADGQPWGIENLHQVDHIDSLAGFNGMLYASGANSGEPSGVRVFRSPTGDAGSWEDALIGIGAGFGDPNNENFKDMLEFDGQLCGGTWNENTGAEVWCTNDGSSWQRKSLSGFGDPQNVIIWSGEVFDGSLYFSTQHQAEPNTFSRWDSGLIYRAQSITGTPRWEQVFDGGRGSRSAVLLGEWHGDMYIATGSINGIRIFKSASGDPGSWVRVGRDGISGSRANTHAQTDGAVVYQGRLHVAVNNPLQGFRVWRLDSDGFWRVVVDPAGPSSDHIAAQLAVWDGALLAWTSNYRTGQAVLQTRCSPATAELHVNTVEWMGLSAALLLTLSAAFWSERRKHV